MYINGESPVRVGGRSLKKIICNYYTDFYEADYGCDIILNAIVNE